MFEDHAHGRAAVIEMTSQYLYIFKQFPMSGRTTSRRIRNCLYVIYDSDRLFAELSPLFFILPAREPLDHRAPLLFACGKKLLCWSCNFLPSRAKSRDWFT